MEEKFLQVNSLRLHLCDWGGQGQPVLLLHGLASNAKIWDWVAPLLVSDFRVAALDQRSHGLSAAPVELDYSYDAVCGDVRAVLTQLNFAPSVLVGHSWGGNVVLECAIRFPELVRGIVLVDPPEMTMNKKLSWEEVLHRLAPPKLAGTPLADFRERIKGFQGERFTSELFEIILGNFEVLPDHTIRPHLAFESHMSIVRAMWEQDYEVLYPQIKCPITFLRCLPSLPYDENTERYVQARRAGAEIIAQLIPQATVEWWSDTIHDVPLQKPAELAAWLKNFIKAL